MCLTSRSPRRRSMSPRGRKRSPSPRGRYSPGPKVSKRGSPRRSPLRDRRSSSRGHLRMDRSPTPVHRRRYNCQNIKFYSKKYHFHRNLAFYSYVINIIQKLNIFALEFSFLVAKRKISSMIV